MILLKILVLLKGNGSKWFESNQPKEDYVIKIKVGS